MLKIENYTQITANYGNFARKITVAGIRDKNFANQLMADLEPNNKPLEVSIKSL